LDQIRNIRGSWQADFKLCCIFTYGRFDLGDFRKSDVPLCLAAQQRSGLQSEIASSADERPNR